jgi:hypothetical protein
MTPTNDYISREEVKEIIRTIKIPAISKWYYIWEIDNLPSLPNPTSQIKELIERKIEKLTSKSSFGTSMIDSFKIEALQELLKEIDSLPNQ